MKELLSRPQAPEWPPVQGHCPPGFLGLVPLSPVRSEGVGLTLIGLVLGNHSPPGGFLRPLTLALGRVGTRHWAGVLRPTPGWVSPLPLGWAFLPSFSSSSRHN